MVSFGIEFCIAKYTLQTNCYLHQIFITISLGMYSTYSSDDAFERMLEKKKLQARFLFPHSPLPKGVTQSQVKTMIKYLNKNPSQREKISAAKEVNI